MQPFRHRLSAICLLVLLPLMQLGAALHGLTHLPHETPARQSGWQSQDEGGLHQSACAICVSFLAGETLAGAASFALYVAALAFSLVVSWHEGYGRRRCLAYFSRAPPFS